LCRFCAECIITALRSGNKECPTCRKKLVSKRSLRPDPNFDQLVEKIFPNREEYEAHQESILESLSRSHSQNFIASITDGIKAQMAHAKAATKKSKPAYDDAGGPDSPHHTPITGANNGGGHSDGDFDGDLPPPKKKKKLKVPTPLQEDAAGEDTDAGGSGSGSSGAPKEVEIVFRMHPVMGDRCKEVATAMRQTSTRYIKTTSKALIDHLCKYLAMRISLDMPQHLVQQAQWQQQQAAAASGSSSSSQPVAGSSSSSSGDGKPNLVKDLIIYVGPSPGNIIELSGSMSLAQVNEKYWKVNKPMEM